MPRPKLLGIAYAVRAAPLLEEWRRLAKSDKEEEGRRADDARTRTKQFEPTRRLLSG